MAVWGAGFLQEVPLKIFWKNWDCVSPTFQGSEFRTLVLRFLVKISIQSNSFLAAAFSHTHRFGWFSLESSFPSLVPLPLLVPLLPLVFLHLLPYHTPSIALPAPLPQSLRSPLSSLRSFTHQCIYLQKN